MVLMQEDTELFERRCAIFVLLAIDKYPNLTKYEIMRIDGKVNEKTKYFRILDLIEAGLVSYDYVKGKDTRRLNLTPEGKKIANNFKKARINYLRFKNKDSTGEKEKTQSVSSSESNNSS